MGADRRPGRLHKHFFSIEGSLEVDILSEGGGVGAACDGRGLEDEGV